MRNSIDKNIIIEMYFAGKSPNSIARELNIKYKLTRATGKFDDNVVRQIVKGLEGYRDRAAALVLSTKLGSHGRRGNYGGLK